MEDKPEEQWKELCDLASKEQDPERLDMLVQEVIRILDEREMSLKKRYQECDGKTSYPPDTPEGQH